MALQDEVIDDDRCETARRTLAMRIAQRNRLRAERLARLRPPARSAPMSESTGESMEESPNVGASAPVSMPVPMPVAAPVTASVTAAGTPSPAPSGLDMTAPPGSALEEFLRALTRAPARPAACGAPPAVSRQAPEAVPETGPDTTPEEAGDSVPDPMGDFASQVGLDPDSVLGTAQGFEPAPAAVLPFERPVPASDAAPAPEATSEMTSGALQDPVCDLARLDGAGPGLIWALKRAGLTSLSDVAALEPDGLAASLGPIGRLVPARAWIETARNATR